MARRVGWTEAALEDLTSAAEYIARDSGHYANALVREAFDASESLAELANRGRIVPEFGVSTVREIFLASYRMVYQVTAERVLILGLVHGARDLVALWRRQGRPGTNEP